jgi:hypothetical protein
VRTGESCWERGEEEIELITVGGLGIVLLFNAAATASPCRWKKVRKRKVIRNRTEKAEDVRLRKSLSLTFQR